MKWNFEPKTGSYTYDEYNGAYGYSVMPYTGKILSNFAKGYALYFHNAWRTERPLGEYITTDARLSCDYAEPSGGLSKELIFDTVEDAQWAAEVHRLNDQWQKANES